MNEYVVHKFGVQTWMIDQSDNWLHDCKLRKKKLKRKKEKKIYIFVECVQEYVSFNDVAVAKPSQAKHIGESSNKTFSKPNVLKCHLNFF